MKIRSLTLIATSLIIITVTLLFQSKNKESKSVHSNQKTQNIEEEKGEQQDPGFYAEWFELKKNEEGVIPRGLLSKWHQHDLRMEVDNPSSSGRMNTGSYLGPDDIGGRTRAILVDEANNNRYFAGGVSGGLWRSENSGANWTPINDMASSLSITCITQNPFNPDEIYYGTGEAQRNSAMLRGTGVFKSNDGGLSFELLASTESNNDFELCNDIEHSQSDDGDDKVYVATSYGLYLSSDAGASWNLITNDFPVYDIISFPSPIGGVLITTEQGLFYSADGSTDFNLIIDSNFPSDFNGIKIENCKDVPNIVYALFTTSDFTGFFKSIDAGQSWTQQTISQTGAGGSQGSYSYTIGVHKSNPDYVIMGGVLMEYSTDGGQTWADASIGHADHQTAEIIPDSPDEILIGTDGGVYKYNWNTIGNTVVDLNNGYNVTQFYKGDYGINKEAVAGAQDNGTYAMDLNGNTSQDLTSGDGFSCYWGKNTPGLAYLSVQKGRIMRRTDFINTDFNCSITDPSADCYQISLSELLGEGADFDTNFEVNTNNEDELYVITPSGLWRLNWTGASPDPYNRQKLSSNISNLEVIALENALDPVLYTGGRVGKFFRVDNASSAGMSNIVDLSDNLPDEVSNHVVVDIAIDPFNTNIVYVGFSSLDEEPRIYKVCNAMTTDPVANPSTWVSIAGNLPSGLPVNAIAVDPEHPDRIIFAGTDYGLYYTLNAGQTWEKESSIPNVPIFDLDMRNSDRSLFVFSHGRGAWLVEVDLSPTNTTFDITGNIYRDNVEVNPGVGLVEIDLCNFTTQSDGDYICPDQASGQAYAITPSKNIFHVNGVSLFDVILIRKHILGILPLDSPYKIIAADANGSNSITTADIVILKELVLYIITELPNNTSWRFVPEDFIFVNPFNPFQTSFPEEIIIDDLEACQAGDNNFIGIKVGDVNNSANPNSFTGSEENNVDIRSKFSLKIKDRKVNSGEVIRIPIIAEEFNEKVAYQFKMGIDQDYFDVIEWEKGDLPGFDGTSFSYIDGQLRTLWISEMEDLSPVTMKEKSSLFTLTLKAKKEVNSLSKVISMEKNDAYSIVYDEGGRKQNISLIVDKGQEQNKGVQKRISSFDVYPNPFKEKLSITYPTSFTNGSLELLDVKGQLLEGAKEAKQTLDLGHLASGVYYLRFISDEGTRMEKIIKQ